MSEGAFEEGTATLVPPPCAAGKNSEIAYTRARIEYWDAYVTGDAQYERFRRFYRQRLIELYRFLIPPGMRVLELGCGRGDLLASLRPSYGVGIDFSTAMIAAATAHHPELRFIHTDAHEFDLRESSTILFVPIW